MPARLCCAGNVGARPRCPRMPTAGDGGEGRMRRSPCVVSSVTFYFFIRFRTPLADPMACLFGSNRTLRGAQGSCGGRA